MEASPLTEVEETLLLEGIQEFDSARYWHAHESWEDMWNSLKRREAPLPEILGIQGLIQTAALLYNHQREKRRGVLNQWEKLLPKLDVWTRLWGVDVVAHLNQIRRFVDDVDTWNETYEQVRIPMEDVERLK